MWKRYLICNFILLNIGNTGDNDDDDGNHEAVASCQSQLLWSAACWPGESVEEFGNLAWSHVAGVRYTKTWSNTNHLPMWCVYPMLLCRADVQLTAKLKRNNDIQYGPRTSSKPLYHQSRNLTTKWMHPPYFSCFIPILRVYLQLLQGSFTAGQKHSRISVRHPSIQKKLSMQNCKLLPVSKCVLDYLAYTHLHILTFAVAYYWTIHCNTDMTW